MDLYTYSWVNSIWTETVTRVHEQEPDPVAMQTTRRLNIYSRVGNLVEQRTELMTADGVWEQIDGVAYEYNVNGKETKRTTFNGLITTSEWAGTCCGKSSETAPDGTRTTFTYDDNGRLIVRTVLDPNPIETHIGYDALGRQTVTWTTNRVAQLGTAPLRTTYDALGRTVSQTDNLGNTTTTAYSANERTRTVTNPIGSTQIAVTDESGRNLSLSGTAVAPRTYAYGVNADGTQWTKIYNGSDATAPAWTKTTENLLGRTIREEKPGFGGTLLTTTNTYDNGGHLLRSVSSSVGGVYAATLQSYDRYGDRLFSALDVNHNGVIDFAGSDRVTGYGTAYITKDNALWQEATQSVYPDFNSDRTVTTAKSRRKLTNLGTVVSVSESEDIHGNMTTTTQFIDCDVNVVVSTTTVPTSIQPQVERLAFSLLIESVLTTAITNHYAYDGLNRRIAVTDGRGNTSITSYNILGQVAYTEDAATNRTSYIYDQYGLQIETVDALNQSTFITYDLRGNVIRQFGSTYPVWYEYDVEGRMIAMATTRDTTLDPSTVDSLDNPSLDVTRWNYDSATGLLVHKLYDDGKGPLYTYTPEAKLATRTWARGVTTAYAYDASGQLTGGDYSDATPDVSYTYDRLGQQLSAITAGFATNLFVYSTNTLELVAETQNGVVINRSRDAFGRESGISMGSDYDVSYGYDSFGRFATVTHAQSTNTFEYSYLPGSPLVSGMNQHCTGGVLSQSFAWTRSYEPSRNLITAVTNSFNDTLISAFDYVNDSIGRRTARIDGLSGAVATTNAFGYNMRSEVASAEMGTNVYAYVFDPIGNTIVVTNNSIATFYVANSLNQYITISNSVITYLSYDDDGNMLTNGVWTYLWDAENRLHSVSSNGVLLATYEYDDHARRIRNTVSGTTFSFLYDDWNLLKQTSQHLQSRNSIDYIWGLDLSGSLHGAGGVGGLLAVRSTYVIEGYTNILSAEFPCFDGNGNVSEYVSTNLIVDAHYGYSPFGETLISFGCMKDLFNYRYATKYWNNDGGLYYYGYRYIIPGEKFISRDPFDESSFIGNIDVESGTFLKGHNLYNLTKNNLISEIDFLGLAYGNPVPGSVSSPLLGPSCPKKCCNGKMVQLVPIWNCTRALAGVVNLGPLKHGYICCNGSNQGCSGIQKYRRHCLKSCLQAVQGRPGAENFCKGRCYSRVGDQIETEVDPSGNCNMKCVSPDEKKAACNNPTMPWDYSVISWHHCYAWANIVTTTKCQ